MLLILMAEIVEAYPAGREGARPRCGFLRSAHGFLQDTKQHISEALQEGQGDDSPAIDERTRFLELD